jgi:tRNA A-37 threonylcarbamoyl transferase component Bud32
LARTFRAHEPEGIILKVTADAFCRDFVLMPTQSVESLSACSASESRAAANTDCDVSKPLSLIRVTAGNARGIGIGSFGVERLGRLTGDPSSLFAATTVWLKTTVDRRVALIFSDAQSPDETYCYKETISRRWWVRLCSRLGSIRTLNAFYHGIALRQLDIRTPQPLATITVNHAGAYHEYLLTETVPGAISLQQWLQNRRPQLADFTGHSERRKLVPQLGLQVRRLHQNGFDHRDLKPSNVLVDETDRIWLIDLDGVWRWPVLPGLRRVQNLARLWAGLAATGDVTMTDAVRFLFAYLKPDDQGTWKSLWRQVARRAAKKIIQLKARSQAANG